MNHRERLLTALQGGIPDRVPCWIKTTRWVRYHDRCPCPRHQAKMAEEFDLDVIVFYASYIWQSVSNDYIYTPGGGYSGSPQGFYGDLPEVDVDIKIENRSNSVLYRRVFTTPAGKLTDVIEWARPNAGYGDGPNPHRVEPLIKTTGDLEALRFLYPPPREDLLADVPILLNDIGDNALVAAMDNTHAGSWGMEALGPEGMLAASVTQPELLEGVCRAAQDCHLRNLHALLDRGLSVVHDSWFQCGPSVGWSPRTFTDVFLPLIREAVDLAHSFEAIYMYQDDGRMKDIIPHLVDAGVDAIGGLQPPEVGDVVLSEIKAKCGHDVALFGGLDPCYVFDRGDPEVVEKAVRQAIVDGGGGGGFVLGTGEAVSPETPAECIKAAVEAVKQYGVYGRDL